MTKHAPALKDFKEGGQIVHPLWMLLREGWVQGVLTLATKAEEGEWQIATPLCSASQMPRRWMPAKARFLSANFLSDESIETQSIDGRPARRTDAHSTHAVPAEVQPPRVAARIEKSNVLARARINRTLPRALAQGTGNASQRQIGQERTAAGVKRNNMVDVESGFLSDLSQAAVLTTLAGALDNLMPQVRGDGHGVTRRAVSRLQRANAAGKEVLRDRQALPLRVARPPSAVSSDLVCRATRGDAAQPLWAGKVSPGRSATPPRIEFACSYAMTRSCGTLLTAERVVQTVIPSSHQKDL